jgi:hypothetical protein
MHGTSTSATIIEGHARGYSIAEGETEGLEPVYKDLPSAVHSYENVLYLAAQTLRALGAGQAYLHFVDADGMKAARVQVPRVEQRAVSDTFFSQLRAAVLARSSFALTTELAVAAIGKREQELYARCATAKEDDALPEPTSFRVKAPSKRANRGRDFAG